MALLSKCAELLLEAALFSGPDDPRLLRDSSDGPRPARSGDRFTGVLKNCVYITRTTGGRDVRVRDCHRLEKRASVFWEWGGEMGGSSRKHSRKLKGIIFLSMADCSSVWCAAMCTRVCTGVSPCLLSPFASPPFLLPIVLHSPFLLLRVWPQPALPFLSLSLHFIPHTEDQDPLFRPH